MAIYETDIKLLESQRLTDNPDGGGRLTGNEVVDGEANNLFPDISQLDLTYGRNNLRKGYMAVMSPNTDTYYGAHVILTEPPKNPNVHACLFDTGSWTDERRDARTRVESYVIPGIEWPGYVWGNHLEGQSTIRILQRLEAELPEPNSTLMIVSDEGDSTERSQYVRVTDVEDHERRLTTGSHDYTRREVIITISQPLRDDHPGHEAARNRSAGDVTKLRRTQVADAARYYGIRALESPAADGDLQVNIGQIFTPLVPATQAEDAVTDQRGAGDVIIEIDSGGTTVEVPDVAMTDRVGIELANRQQTYVHSLVPLPQPGTIQIDYRSQGRWYRLTDNGEGNLTGTGAGSVDYETGTLQATLEELPDVGTAIIYTWGAAGNQFKDASGESWASIDPPEYRETLDKAVQPGTLQIAYVSNGTTYTLTDDGSGGLTGDGTGAVWYTTRFLGGGVDAITQLPEVYFQPSQTPDAGSIIQITADEPTEEEETFQSPADAQGDVSVQLQGAFTQGSIEVAWRVRRTREWAERHAYDDDVSGEESRLLNRTAKDDGNGNLVRQGSTIGSINYSTGEISITVIEPYTYMRRERRAALSVGSNPAYETTETTETEELAGDVTVTYADTSPPSGAGWQQDILADELGADVNLLGLNTQYTIVPGSLRFTWGGVTYGDNDGELLRDPDGSATPAGTIDYGSGDARITDMPGNTGSSISINRMVVSQGLISTNTAFFRTPAPQRPGSLIVQATGVDGTQLNAQADTSNQISGDGVTGTVDPETGVVEVDFGQQVMPGTIRYSTVAYRYVPLDADILGLDPVRLPQDGRVPFVRPGDVAVVHNTQTTDIGDGSTSTDLGRTRLSYVHVFDANGDRVPDADVIADLDAGTVEVDQATDSPAPFSAEHRIEDMLLVSEAQITGVVSFARQLTHDYPAGDTYLSTALLIGDLQARVYNLFSQESWNDEWSDDPTSDGTTASYNEVQYPIVVTNDGAIEERWALYFNTSSTVDVIGEYTGQVLTGVSIDQVIAPTNPETGEPYFSIPPEGWGGGWATGNLLRFNTSAANYPLWIARTILAGEVEDANDAFRIQIRGDAN